MGTRLDFSPVRKPLVFAHRGFSGAAPESTLAAFRKAMEAGADMLECDVRLSKDRQVVVMHDPTLERTTNGRGRVVDHTLDALKRLDAGAWFGPDFARERIPTLEDLLDLAGGRILVNIEIKEDGLAPYGIEELSDRTLDEVVAAKMLDQVLFSSFQSAALERLMEREPRGRVAFLYNRPWSGLSEVTGGKRYPALNLRHTHLTQEKVDAIHRDGMTVNVYTVNAPEEMLRFVRWGVEGIITNHPDRLMAILRDRPR